MHWPLRVDRTWDYQSCYLDLCSMIKNHSFEYRGSVFEFPVMIPVPCIYIYIAWTKTRFSIVFHWPWCLIIITCINLHIIFHPVSASYFTTFPLMPNGQTLPWFGGQFWWFCQTCRSSDIYSQWTSSIQISDHDHNIHPACLAANYQ